LQELAKSAFESSSATLAHSPSTAASILGTPLLANGQSRATLATLARQPHTQRSDPLQLVLEHALLSTPGGQSSLGALPKLTPAQATASRIVQWVLMADAKARLMGPTAARQGASRSMAQLLAAVVREAARMEAASAGSTAKGLVPLSTERAGQMFSRAMVSSGVISLGSSTVVGR